MHNESNVHKIHEHLNLRSESTKIFTSLKLFLKEFWTIFTDGSGALWKCCAQSVWIFDRQEWDRQKVQFLSFSWKLYLIWYHSIRKEIKPMAWLNAFYNART